MYETMVFWESPPDLAAQPPFVQDFAEIWQAADKIVYSKTLQAASSARTRIEREFDPEAVGRVPPVPRALRRRRRQASLPDSVRVNLELVHERRFRNGTVYLHYRRTNGARER
jgi:hypothetical protein